MPDGCSMRGLLRLLAVAAAGLMMMAAADSSIDSIAHQSLQSLTSNMADDGLALRDLFEITDQNQLVAKSRKKRVIELPKHLVFEIKWNIDIPIKTFTRFDVALQFAWLIDVIYGGEFLHDSEEGPLLAELLSPEMAEFLVDKYTGKIEYPDYDRNDGVYVLHRRKRSLRSDREKIYLGLEKIFGSPEMPPRDCLLRTICEVAEAPFEKDLLGILINILFQPSREKQPLLSDNFHQFLSAESHGRQNGSCHRQYSSCPKSVFKSIPFLEHKVHHK